MAVVLPQSPLVPPLPDGIPDGQRTVHSDICPHLFDIAQGQHIMRIAVAFPEDHFLVRKLLHISSEIFVWAEDDFIGIHRLYHLDRIGRCTADVGDGLHLCR